MERIITMDEAIQEFSEKKENEESKESLEQFSNPKTVGKKITATQILLRQFLMSVLIVLIMLLFKIMIPDLYEEVIEYINIRFSMMDLPW